MALQYEPLKGRAELTAQAKLYLKGKWLEAAVFVFVATLLTSAGSYFSNIFMMFENGSAFSFLFMLAYICLVGFPFSSAIFKYFRHLTDNKYVSMAELTKPFSYYSTVVIFCVLSLAVVIVPIVAVILIYFA